jgi:shikimate dehydrogenase
MHEAAARALGIALTYELFAVEPGSFEAAVRTQHARSIDGYNLTVPHKQAVIALLDEVSPQGRAIGAVNTVVRAEDHYIGHNTDAPGLVRALDEAGVVVRGARIAVVGAGGAARAGVVGLAEAGASRITVLARRLEQADELVRALGTHVPCPLEASALDDASAHFADASLLVQATSATLGSNADAPQFAASLPIGALPAGAAVVDMVYQPVVTKLLERARDRGLKTVDGLGMLLHQGAIAFEMWTGFEPPLDVMRKALSD